MSQVLHKNKYYKITYDIVKNRLIVKPIGFWRSVEVVPNYLQQLKDVLDKNVRKKFMVILDMSDMLTHPREVQEQIHLEASKYTATKKPSAVVIVIPKDDISAMQANFLQRQLGIQTKSFNTIEEAHAFLDDYREKYGIG
ncbi:MAG: hypothetical protein ACPGJS_21665 [Flammeovirgaceae bacterium]